jgi:ribonuclease E
MAAEDSPGSDQTAEFPPIVTESVVMKAPYAAEHEPAEVSLGEELEAAPVPAPAPVVPLMAAPVARELPAPAAIAVAAPPVAPYQLPTDTLAAIASDAGLQWVNSDADKIRAVQEAMASEPKPIHVPRQPKPAAVVDNGPLVLVETKKDLSQVRLPFDSTPPAAQ